MDVVFAGRIVNVRGETSRIGIRRGEEFVEKKTCQLVTPALKINLQMEASFYGKIEESPSVFVGGSQVAMFQPQPRFSKNGEVSWYENPGNARKGLKEDQRLLLGLRLTQSGQLSLMGEPIFGVNDDGTIVARPNSGDCGESVPPELDGMNISDLAKALEKCSGVDLQRGSARKEQRLAEWTKDPFLVTAAECHDGDPKSAELLLGEPSQGNLAEAVHIVNSEIPEPPPRARPN